MSAEASAVPLAASRATRVASHRWQGARSGASRAGCAAGLRSASSAALILEVKGNLARPAAGFLPRFLLCSRLCVL